jgi:ABC-2 type transport system permease protein
MAALLALSIAVIAVATPATGSGIEQGKLERSLATAFGHLYRVQTQQLHRPDVTEAQLRAAATCDKGGGLVANSGPGNGWRCVVTWHLPGVAAEGQAVYQLNVTADGRYIADGDGPREVNGYFIVSTPTGDAPNPLWQFDGIVDLLETAPKG